MCLKSKYNNNAMFDLKSVTQMEGLSPKVISRILREVTYFFVTCLVMHLITQYMHPTNENF